MPGKKNIIQFRSVGKKITADIRMEEGLELVGHSLELTIHGEIIKSHEVDGITVVDEFRITRVEVESD